MSQVESPMETSRRPLGGLFTTQFFGAFNDNAWKMVVAFLMKQAITPAVAQQQEMTVEAAQQQQITLAFVVFTLPLMLFSLPAGSLADRISKRSLILAMKVLELLLMAAGTLVLYLDPTDQIMPLVVLGLMGLQSSLFSPAKYGIMPELLSHDRLAQGNGLLNMWTMMAIIAGTGAGGLLKDGVAQPWMAGMVLVALSTVGLVASFFVPRVPAIRESAGTLETITRSWRSLRADRSLWLTVMGLTFFWAVGSLLGQDILIYAANNLGMGDGPAGLVLAAFAVGVGLGAVLAGWISRGRIEVGLIPLGALGLGLGTLYMGLFTPGLVGTYVTMALLGVASGLMLVPMESQLQWRAPADNRGGVIALSNVFVFGGVLAGTLLCGWLSSMGLKADQIILVAGVFTLAGTIWALWLLPMALIRMCLVLLTHTLYRLRVVDRQHVPESGGALLVANHVSLVDGLFLIGSIDRPVRFIVDSGYFHNWMLRPLMKVLGAIPISGGNPKELMRAMKAAGEYLEKGELVCIFAEGEITRTGAMLPFRRGVERILKGRSAAIIPVHLDQVWGSLFSHKGGGFLKSLDGPLPRPVTVSFGAPLPATTPVHAVRQQVVALGREAWCQRESRCAALHHALIRRARRRPWALAVADSSGKQLSLLKTLTASVALARCLRGQLQANERLGILLPPSVGSALCNFAAALSGRCSVNLNFTTGTAGMASALKQAEVTQVVTSQQFLDKAGVQLPEGVKVLDLAELLQCMGPMQRFTAMLLGMLAPKTWLEKACGATQPVKAKDLCTIIFSSGSTGEPKGVMLSHGNVGANVEGVSMILHAARSDRLLGILPHFHSFGYMALWYSVHNSTACIFHPNPMDAAVIGPLVQKQKVTFLLATPTFLQVYMRRCTPGQFGSLRLVLTGAEKLTTQLAQAFEDKFGIRPLEGYGASECSPVVAVSAFDYRAKGFYQPGYRRGYVGQALPGVEVQAVQQDSFELLPPNEAGMLLVRGPNIMQGYLGRDDLTAKAMREGWYITGDIGMVDEDGFIRITDRLSRFSKIGGEMVPHGKVEETLHQVAQSTEQVFAVTGIPDAKKGERLAVLYTLAEDRIPAVVQGMADSGLPNLFIPKQDQFIKVDSIPILGTGKMDLKAVRKVAMQAFGVEAEA